MSEDKTSRRRFLKSAAIGGAAVVATGGAAGKIASIAMDKSIRGNDKKYINVGDSVMSERQYVEMDTTEKVEQVRKFVDNYKYEAV